MNSQLDKAHIKHVCATAGRRASCLICSLILLQFKLVDLQDLPQNHVIAWPIFHMRTHVLLLKEDYKCIYARHSSVVHIE